MKTAVWAARILLAAVFLYAGIAKLGTSERFAVTVAQFSLPEAGIMLMARTLPWAETLTGILLLVPRTARWGALFSVVLLMTFIGALAWALHQGIVFDCGCFGEDPEPSGDKMVFALWRDVALLALTLALAGRRLPR